MHPNGQRDEAATRRPVVQIMARLSGTKLEIARTVFYLAFILVSSDVFGSGCASSIAGLNMVDSKIRPRTTYNSESPPLE